MGRSKKEITRQTISINTSTYEWIAYFAEEHGMDITAAVNFLLTEAKRKIELHRQAEDNIIRSISEKAKEEERESSKIAES